MNRNKIFLNFLESLKNESNGQIVEGIKSAFSAINEANVTDSYPLDRQDSEGTEVSEIYIDALDQTDIDAVKSNMARELSEKSRGPLYWVGLAIANLSSYDANLDKLEEACDYIKESSGKLNAIFNEIDDIVKSAIEKHIAEQERKNGNDISKLSSVVIDDIDTSELKQYASEYLDDSLRNVLKKRNL